MKYDITYSGNNLNGIIRNFITKFSSIDDIITVSASSVLFERPECTLNSSLCPHSFSTNIVDSEPQWLMVEFCKAIIYLNSYSLLSSFNDPGSYFHLKGWDLKASIDGEKWDIIDSHSNSEELNSLGANKNFNCSEGLYRFFKVQQTEKGFTGKYGFSIRQIEFFGTVIETEYVPKPHMHSCVRKYKYSNFNIFSLNYI